MTLRQLATHTSGIWDYADTIIGAGEKDDTVMKRYYSPGELIQYAIDNGEPSFSPGEEGRWKYTNTGYILLGLVIEKVTGKKYGDLLHERFFLPLKLTDTSFPDTVPETDRLVRGYIFYPGGKDTTAWNLSQGWAAGGVLSTAADMQTFLNALANGRFFRDPSTLLAMGQFVRNDDVSQQLGVKGYGIGLIEYTNGVWGHAGQTLGFESEMMFVPGTNISMIALTNAAQGPALQMRAMVPAVQSLAGILPEVTAAFPRPEPDYQGKRSLDFKPLVAAMNDLSADRIAELDTLLLSATIDEIQQYLVATKTSSRELVLYYLQRIQAYDWNILNSVIELNPQILEIADKLDQERAQGTSHGPMHGIPILLKDNIAVTGMHATAGAWAMRDWQPDRDAALVKNLRDAGALILGKANLSEWANYMDPGMPSGFSALGGQTRNPYGAYEVLGSSSGSAVSASANLAAATVGTETQGSIIQPASINGVVAIKTSKGRVSTDNIIPLVDWMDVPGPMARNVADAALLLNAMLDTDKGLDLGAILTADAAHGMRIGISILSQEGAEKMADAYSLPDDQKQQLANILMDKNARARQAALPFKDLSLEIVEIDQAELPLPPTVNDILPYGFKDSLNRFLSKLGDASPVASLADIISLNTEASKDRAPYGQSYLTGADGTAMTEQEYNKQVETNRSTAIDGLARVFKKHKIQALISTSQAYAPAGFPAITVPAGYSDAGEPYGLMMIGNNMGEADLIRAAYAYEQHTQARKLPDLDNTVQEIMKLK
jgi:amidase